MKTMMTIQLRTFDVSIKDHRTGEQRKDSIVLTKAQLQAAQMVGQSSKELIERLYNRRGYGVQDIGSAEKREVCLNLEELARQYAEHQDAKAKWEYLYGGGVD